MIYSVSCAILWASTGIFVKLLSPLSINYILFGRFGIALLISCFFIKQARLYEKTSERFLLAMMMTLYYIFATYAFYFAPIAIAALLISLAPLFTLLIRLINKQPVYLNEPLGFLIAICGLAYYFWLTAGVTYYEAGPLLLGSGLALLAALLRALFSYRIWCNGAQKKPVNIHQINIDTLAVGCMLTLPLMVLEHAPLQISGVAMLNIIGLGVIATLLPNILNNIASTKTSPTAHNMICMSTPVAASLMAWLFIGEPQTVASLLAMLTSITGIYLASRVPPTISARPKEE